jgi:protoporphyrinogen oxidase
VSKVPKVVTSRVDGDVRVCGPARNLSTILEADHIVGALSRKVERDGWCFDIVRHCFFTKLEVKAFWHEILHDEDFMLCPRMSRIYDNGRY